MRVGRIIMKTKTEKRKQQSKVTETKRVRKEEETGPVEGVTRDVLNSLRRTRKRTRNKQKDERN